MEDGTLDLLRDGKLGIGLGGHKGVGKQDEPVKSFVMSLPIMERKKPGSFGIGSGSGSGGLSMPFMTGKKPGTFGLSSTTAAAATFPAPVIKGKKDGDVEMGDGDESDGGFFE